VDLAKDFSTQFNPSDLFALYQLLRTWQIGLAESTESLLEASSSPLEQDFNLGPQILGCSLRGDSSVSLFGPFFDHHNNSYCSRSWLWDQWNRQSSPHYRTGPPQRTWKDHCNLQHLLLLRLNHCSLDNIRHITNLQQLVMETSKSSTSSTKCLSALFPLASSRKSKVPDFQRSTR
jgi:hypothetical protein